jgi:AcrR family transcriptional regulator
LFAERGFSSVSVDELGTALGVSGPALYHHFPSKDALLAAIVLETMQEAVTVAETTAAELDRMAPAGVLAVLVRRIVALEMERRDDIAVYLRDGHLLDRPTVRELHRREERLARAWYRVIHAVAPDLPGRTVVLAMNAMGGLLNSAVRERTPIAQDELESTLARMFHGLLECISALPGRDAPESPGSAGVWQPQRRPRREALLAAATELFDQRGFHGVGIADIGAATGVSGAAVYRHFRSKEELLSAAIDRARERLAIAFADATGAARSADDALRRLIVAYATIALENRHLIAIYQREVAHLPADKQAAIRRERRAFVSQWADVLQDVRPDITRPASIVMVHGVMGAVDRVGRVAAMRESTTPTELQALLTAALLH